MNTSLRQTNHEIWPLSLSNIMVLCINFEHFNKTRKPIYSRSVSPGDMLQLATALFTEFNDQLRPQGLTPQNGGSRPWGRGWTNDVIGWASFRDVTFITNHRRSAEIQRTHPRPFSLSPLQHCRSIWLVVSYARFVRT